MADLTTKAMTIAGFMIFGSLNTIGTKYQFSASAEGDDGEVKKFHKPWFASLRMFFSMFLLLFVYCAGNVLVWLKSSGKKKDEGAG